MTAPPAGGSAFQGADVAALDRAAAAVGRAAATLTGSRDGVAAIAVRLRDGAVAHGPGPRAYAEHLDTVVVRDLDRAAARLATAARDLVRNADEQRGASAATGPPSPPASPPSSPSSEGPGPPAGAPTTAAAAVAGFFGRLGDADAARLADLVPAVVGRLDGAPAWVRDRANRHLLGPAIADLRAERASLQARLAHAADTPELLARWRRQLDGVEGRLVTLTRIDRDPQVQLLVLDAATGRIAAAVGDVDRATHLATIVPGTGADLASFSGYLDRADELRFTTQQAAGRGDVAVVAWLDYEAPPGLVNAVSPARAVAAAPALAAFGEGLAVVNPQARRTLLGHSYGATVVGETAARFDVDVAAVVGVAAPGMRVRDAVQLRVPDDAHVYAVTDRRGAPWRQDPIAFVDGGILTIGLGPDPATIGARSFDVGDADGHALAGYLDRTTRAGRNLGAVVAGLDPPHP